MKKSKSKYACPICNTPMDTDDDGEGISVTCPIDGCLFHHLSYTKAMGCCTVSTKAGRHQELKRMLDIIHAGHRLKTRQSRLRPDGSKNPTIKLAKKLCEEHGGRGVIVLVFDKEQVAGASYGVTKALCEEYGIALDNIIIAFLTGTF